MLTYIYGCREQTKLDKNRVLRGMAVFFLTLLMVGVTQAVTISLAATPPTAGTIERSQEILQEDQALRQQVEQENKVFVKKIVLKGVTRLSKEEINDLIAPFENQWMTKKDIQQVIDSLKLAYEKKGIQASQLKIKYELKKSKTLEITVAELTH